MLNYREGDFQVEIQVEDQLEYKIKFDELMVVTVITNQSRRMKFPFQTECF